MAGSSMQTRRSLFKKLANFLAEQLPSEWATWGDVAGEMGRFRSPDRREKVRNRLFSVLIFALGAIPGALASPAVVELSEGALGAIFGGVLAFCGLLVGFLVTLMLFTGRLGAVQSLSFEDLRSYGSRLRYLLVSQAVTLAFAMICAVLCISYLIVYFLGAPLLLHSVNLAMLLGFLMLCLARSALLPIQIFELHDAHLHDELSAKAEDNNKKYK
jgi:hypothetical protein